MKGYFLMKKIVMIALLSFSSLPAFGFEDEKIVRLEGGTEIILEALQPTKVVCEVSPESACQARVLRTGGNYTAEVYQNQQRIFYSTGHVSSQAASKDAFGFVKQSQELGICR
jgi:hypothetical protein